MLFWDTSSSLWDRMLLIAGVIGLYWIVWIIYARTFHPYARYPGPFLASFSRSWIVMEILRGQAHRTQAELHKKYGIPTSLHEHTDAHYMSGKGNTKFTKGPIIRIAPNEVAISDPASIKEIYGVSSRFSKVGFAHHYISSLPVLIRWGRPISTLPGDLTLVRISCYI